MTKIVIVGEMFYSDLSVGGGPMPGGPSVSHPIAPGGPPLGIWGGAPPYVDAGFPGPQPHPSHPIVLPPLPPGPGVPTHPIYIPAPGTPTHPIVLPPPTEGLGEGGGKPPPPEGGWGFHPQYGWGYFPSQTEPSPKKA